MFGSRRSTAPPPETAKVAEVVQAYYDAGRRPASHLTTPPAVTEVDVAGVAATDEAPFSAPEPDFPPEPEPAPAVVPEAAHAEAVSHSGPVHKTLGELAEELEAFIEVIRYGDDLGSRTARA